MITFFPAISSNTESYGPFIIMKASVFGSRAGSAAPDSVHFGEPCRRTSARAWSRGGRQQGRPFILAFTRIISHSKRLALHKRTASRITFQQNYRHKNKLFKVLIANESRFCDKERVLL